MKIPEENAAAALEVMSRFAVDPRWLVYLPPTMSPAATSKLDGYLEHPEQAFEEYAGWGVTRVVCEEKHMGSRAVAVLARTPTPPSDGSASATAPPASSTPAPADRSSPTPTRARRPARARRAAPLFESLDTDWLALDCELLPWSAKAVELIKAQYASVGAAARRRAARGARRARPGSRSRTRCHGAPAKRASVGAATPSLPRRLRGLLSDPTDGLDGVTLAPFQILAAEGARWRSPSRTRGTWPSWPSWRVT